MQEISKEVRRFQEIKAKEKLKAIVRATVNAEKAKIQQANPALSTGQVEEIYRRSHQIKNIPISNHRKN